MIFDELVDKLTSREMDVLLSAAEGRTNKQIAKALHTTEGTVEQYLDRIYSKLGLSRADGSPRTRAILILLQNRLGS